jgi:aldose 1-epimerase
MQVKTNQPCMVIYTPPSTGSICFETQNYPDAPNHANFPSSILQPGEAYKNESIFKFSVR